MSWLFEKLQCQLIFFLNTHKNNTCLQPIVMFVPLSAMINEIIDEFCMLSSIYRQRYKVSVFLSSWALKHKFKCGYNNDMVYTVSWYIALENGNKIDEINRVRTKAAHNKCFNLYLLYLWLVSAHKWGVMDIQTCQTHTQSFFALKLTR